MTGGAFGSMIAQLFHLTAAERKTLLVAGAAAGMSATFASPIAAVLLAVELLLFEMEAAQLRPGRARLRHRGRRRAASCSAPGRCSRCRTHAAFVGTPALARLRRRGPARRRRCRRC